MPEKLFEAVLFDLDGVITKTARVHSRAWKQTFDEYLARQATRDGVSFKEFTHDKDYLPFVDGKPRYEGVSSFLESRGINLPWGSPQDQPELETICGIGNRKNVLVGELIEQGVEVFPSTIELIEALRARGVSVGVASSSKNCRAVLVSAGIEPLFETRIDGVVSVERGLSGKPAPDIFLEACEDLGARPERSVVVEDALSGVRAGARGNFGLVIGVAREGNHEELKKHGADITVDDLEDVDLDLLDSWFTTGIGQSTWVLNYDDLISEEEPLREALCTVGNGYLGTRGALEERSADDMSYPGTYVCGVYNRLESVVAGRRIENEDLVNCPNWLPLTFRIDGGDWLDPAEVEVLELRRSLDLRHGILSRRMVIRDGRGLETEVRSSRVVSMADAHLCALRYSVTPLNYHGTIRFRSCLDGDVINWGVARYRQLASRHLEPLHIGGEGGESRLLVRTSQSGIEVAIAARIELRQENLAPAPDVSVQLSRLAVSSELETCVEQGKTVTVDKVVSIVTSRDGADPLSIAEESLLGAGDFSHVAAASSKCWGDLWSAADMRIEGDRRAQLLLRLHIFHLLCTTSPHSAGRDVSIPARGLHGEAYRGHIFWDVSFVLPLYSMYLPEVARSLLDYRYTRLGVARDAASAEGFTGAMFPWQSGSDGREESQIVHLNPLSGTWGPDNSRLQRHLSLAIALDLWNHRIHAVDRDFFVDRGTELFLHICRFWADQARRVPETGRFVIDKVMGPDEYHEGLPGAGAGLKDNSYTNVMVAWVLSKADLLLEDLGPLHRDRVLRAVGITDADLEHWREVGRQLTLVFEEGILAQFDGYFELEELDWGRYRQQHSSIHRLDRILKAEGDSPDRYKLSKQADALMIFYNLSLDEAESVIRSLGFSRELDDGRGERGFLARNFDYHLSRTSHGSTLSKVVHAYLACLLGLSDRAFELYFEALESDFVDVQGGTTPEGIHTGVMGGTVLTAIRGFAGVDFGGPRLRLEPRLPKRWREMSFAVTYHGDRYQITVSHDAVEVLLAPQSSATEIEVLGAVRKLEPGSKVRIEMGEDQERREGDVG